MAGKIVAVTSTLGILFATVLTAQTNYLDQDNVVDWARGKYAYVSTADGTQNGEEDWFLTVHSDGSRTLRATNSYDDRMKTFRPGLGEFGGTLSGSHAKPAFRICGVLED